MDLQIECRNIDMAPRWKTEIEQRMQSLQVGHDDLIHGRVTLTKNKHHKKEARVAESLVLVTLPGRHTITARKEEKTFEEAIRAAFSAVEIELQKYRGKRGATQVRTEPTTPLRGVISKLFPEEGYGFILQDGGSEVYFHQNALRELNFHDLGDGTDVVINAASGEKGEHATVVLPPPAIAGQE
jgi:cold shock CspA family protein/ribosome-associated translation inhibitor RaiA